MSATTVSADPLERLVLDNADLAHAIARPFTWWSHQRGLEYDDIAQAGLVGLVIAAKKHVPGRAKFSTYAHVCIRRAIVRAIRRSAPLAQLPVDDNDEEVIQPAARPEVDPAVLELVARLLCVLPQRERQVIELRFGLADGQDHNLEAIGRQLGMTHQRAQQIEQRAMTRLRAHAAVLAGEAGAG